MKKALAPFRAPGEVKRATALPSLAIVEVPTKFSDVGHFEDVAVEAWRRSQREVVRFGRILRTAKESFEHGEFMAALDRIAETVGESANALRRVMRVAEAIDEGVLPGPAMEWESVPAKADEVQALVRRLPPERLEEAKAAGLISPDTPVSAIRAYAKSLKGDATVKAPTISALLHRKATLLDQIARAQAEIADIDRQLEERGA